MNHKLKSKRLIIFTGMVTAVLLGLLPFLMNVGETAVAQNEAAPVITEEQAVAIATGQEAGGNHFRISSMGADDLYDAFKPAVAYNATANEYLVVWYGDNNLSLPDATPLVDGEFEIYGQRVNAATGEEIGPNDFRISDMGPDGDVAYDAFHPAVAYDAVLNQYLVVWEGDENKSPLADEDFEIFGQLLSADGVEIGTNDFRISKMGIEDGNPDFPAAHPDVTYNPAAKEYLVVWEGVIRTQSGPSLADEIEIFGQRLNAATGAEVGTNDFRISQMGPPVDSAYGAFDPAVAYNTKGNQYLVVWSGDDAINGENEIYGQLLQADGTETGLDDFRISDMGPEGDANFDAYRPAVAHDTVLNQYLVVWEGEDDIAALVNDEYEIFGQLLQANGTEITPNDFRISDIGPDGDAAFDSSIPDVVYNAAVQEYLVVWFSKDQFTLADVLEMEVYGQRLKAGTGEELGNDFRISDVGPDGDADYNAAFPAVAHGSTNNQYLVVWQGDDDIAPLAEDEFEIFSQLIQADGTETGQNDRRLSDMGSDELYDADQPAVAYNTQDNEFLVVWQGEDNGSGLANGEYEIFGRLLDADTGQPLSDDFRLSDIGSNESANFDAYNPAVAYNSTLNQYLIVWEGYAEVGSPPTNKYEIFGQLLLADGTETGGNDFRISRSGPESDGNSFATTPDVTYNTTTRQFLVVWERSVYLTDSNTFESEIYGRHLNATTGQPVEDNDFRISQVGPDGNNDYNAYGPAITYNSTQNQYLVVWVGDDDKGALVNNEYEIFGQLLNADGTETGTDDFRISDMGPNGNTSFVARNPAATYDSTLNQYLVIWEGSEDLTNSNIAENEIFGQLLQANGAETGLNDFRISRMGADGNDNAEALRPAVTYHPASEQYLVVWQGDQGEQDNSEYEIFGQRLQPDGTEAGIDDFRLSNMGPDGSAAYDATVPAVSCQTDAAQCLVIWRGDDDTPPLVDNEYEIFGQLQILKDFSIYLPLVVKP